MHLLPAKVNAEVGAFAVCNTAHYTQSQEDTMSSTIAEALFTAKQINGQQLGLHVNAKLKALAPVCINGHPVNEVSLEQYGCGEDAVTEEAGEQ